jgi:hypothetical protein
MAATIRCRKVHEPVSGIVNEAGAPRRTASPDVVEDGALDFVLGERLAPPPAFLSATNALTQSHDDFLPEVSASVSS